MDTVDLDGKLTPAAREALTELCSDYRRQILLEAAQSASRATGELREISVHDVLGALSKVSAGPGSGVPSPFERILNLYMLLGLLLGGLGLGYYGIHDLLGAVDVERRLPLLVSAAGFMMAAFSLVLSRTRQLRYFFPASKRESAISATPEMIGLYISRWQQIEVAIRSIASSRLGESLAIEPLSALISRLSDDGTLTAEDATRLRRLLNTRNQLVHQGIKAQATDITALLSEAERILNKLVSVAETGYGPNA